MNIMNKITGRYVAVGIGFVILAIFTSFVALPQPAYAQLSRFIPGLPFGGKITIVVPNPPPTPATPNPCYEPGSYIITIGFPKPIIAILKTDVKVINGTNPPTPGVWSLGFYTIDRSGACATPVIKLIGVSGLF